MSEKLSSKASVNRQSSDGLSHPSSNHSDPSRGGFLGKRQLFRERGSTRTLLRLDDPKRIKSQRLATGVIRESEVEEVFTHKNPGEARRRWKTAQLYATAARRFSIRQNFQEETNQDEEEGNAGAGEDAEIRQYRLRAKKQYVSSREWVAGQLLMPSSSEQQITGGRNWRFDTILTMYLHWTFRTSFTVLLVISALAFLGFCIIFAALFMLFGHFQPICIYVGKDNGFDEGGKGFGDAFALSWTTFSTVGYGLVYPQISVNTDAPCVLINMFASFEAFVGVIFVGFVGAIIFGKIARVQSFADVEFSDPIVVKYGSGLLTNTSDEDDTNGENILEVTSSDNLETDASPYPELEFRIVNPKYNIPGGEILNANVNCTAVIQASEVTPTIRLAANRRRSLRNLQALEKQNQQYVAGHRLSLKAAGHAVGNIVGAAASKLTPRASLPPTVDEGESLREDGLKVTEHDMPNQHVTLIQAAAKHTVHEDDPSGEIVPARIFSNLEVDTPFHPLFKRVWTIRHTIDENSPLLTREAKQMLTLNNGVWPEEFNTYEKVRESIHFAQIIVSFSGTSDASANTVYAQHVYDFVDVNVGYSFVNLLYKQEGRLWVDKELINDVVEQRGGGAEPFENVEEGFFPNLAEKTAEVTHKTGEVMTGAAEKTGDAVTDAVENIKDAIGPKDD